ncbi:GspE/PulE family protein [Candidatus Omnitrophota bacterium]
MVEKPDKKKSLVGEELVKAGILTPEQLKFALGEQNKLEGKAKERLGEVIIRCGLVEEETMVRFLGKHIGIPYMSLRDVREVDSQALRLIPERMARNFRVIPMRVEDDKLHLAMANPFDVIALDTIRAKTGYEIVRWFSLSAEVEEAVKKFYQKSAIEESIHEFVSLKEEEAKKVESAAGVASINYKQMEIEAGKTPVIEYVNKLMEDAAREGASDIHIEPQEKALSVRYRVDGLLRDGVPPPKEMESSIITRVKLVAGMDIAERRLPQDGRFKFEYKSRDIDVRVASNPIIYGEKLVMRLLDKKSLILGMGELGLEPTDLKIVKMALAQPHGMILVSGPTGSGKTTTLYSALSYLNKPDRNILTIEDPVEYRLKGINQTQIKPLIGLTFASTLRTILRQDPDIIMIGEIRDLETLENAVKAALTGHLVLSTIHTNDAVSVIYRLIHMGLEPYLVVACLNVAIAQRLIRRICPKCKEKLVMTDAARKGLEDRTGTDLSKITFYKGKGCKACDDTGFKGRVGIYELFTLSDEIKKMILDGAPEKELRQVSEKYGRKDLFRSGLEKVDKGLTTIEEVLKVSFIEKVL